MPLGPVVLNGSLGVLPPRQQAALLGNYFTVTNPTPGTAIAYANQTAFSATANGLFSIANAEPTGGRAVALDYLKLKQTATAPTGTLVMNFEVFNETGIVAMTTLVATRTAVSLANQPAPGTLTVQSFAAGAATVPAAVGVRRQQTLGWIDTGVSVAQDTYFLQFGGDAVGSAGLTAARATDPATVVGVAGPATVPPQSTSWINMWWVTSAANVPSFEFELGLYFI